MNYKESLDDYLCWAFESSYMRSARRIDQTPKTDNLLFSLRVYGGYVDVRLTPIRKLSGVKFYQVKRIAYRATDEGIKLSKAQKQSWVDAVRPGVEKWRWIYKPAERFVGGVIDGREQGVLLIHSPEEENS